MDDFLGLYNTNSSSSGNSSSDSSYNQGYGSSGSSYDESVSRSVDDQDIEAFLRSKKANIKVVGCGGGGNNTLNRMAAVGIRGVETIAINTDAQDLLNTSASRKILIGKEITKGMGAGADPLVGEEAARESEHEIKEALAGADMVFVTCGLGGGTGSGCVSVVAEQAKKIGALVISVVTLPFEMEGQTRQDNSSFALDKLEFVSDTLIVIPNDKLLELAPDLPLQTAFRIADEILTNAVKGIAELITKAGLINLDFADIKSVMSEGGVALIGVGDSDSSNRAEEAISKAISNPILDADISGASGALVNVSGGSDMTLNEAKHVVEIVSQKLHPDSKVIWGARIDESIESKLNVMLIVTGVTSPQIVGSSVGGFSQKQSKENFDDLGIAFIG